MYLGDLGRGNDPTYGMTRTVSQASMQSQAKAVPYPTPLGKYNYYVPAQLPNAKPWFDPIKGTRQIGYTFTDSAGRKAWLLSNDGPLYKTAEGRIYARAVVPPVFSHFMRIGWTPGLLPGTVITSGDGRNTQTVVVGASTGSGRGSGVATYNNQPIANEISVPYFYSDPYAGGAYEYLAKKDNDLGMWVAFAAVVLAPVAVALLAPAAGAGAAAATGGAGGTAAATGATAATAATGATATAATGATAATAAAALPGIGAGATAVIPTAATVTGTVAATGTAAAATTGAGLLATLKTALPAVLGATQAVMKAKDLLSQADQAEKKSEQFMAQNREAEAALQAAYAAEYRAQANQLVPGIDNRISIGVGVGLAALIGFLLLRKRKRR